MRARELHRITGASVCDMLDGYCIQAHTWTTATFCVASQLATLAQSSGARRSQDLTV